MHKLGLMFLGAVAILASSRAHAYPQWQFSSGTARCNQCHFSPAGGGLLTSYGRDANGDDLSTWQGNGGFAHGAVDLPSWLALGFDSRLAYTRHDAGNSSGPRQAVFPMQADVQARAAFSGAWSAQVNVGYRGQARPANELLDGGNYQPQAASKFVSREHFVIWRPAALGAYVRAGRFFAPYGLRLSEHIMYVRRDMGFGLLEETYGVSGGVVKNDWEAHVTAFGPDFLRALNSRDAGAAGMFEKRFGDAAALGVDTRLSFGDGVSRYAGGAFGKVYIEAAKLLLQAEGNLVRSIFAGGATGTATNGFVGYAGATVFPVRGVWASAFAERRQTSIAVKDTGTNAYGGQINWFPCPHVELFLMGRVQAPAGAESATQTLLFFLHYFL